MCLCPSRLVCLFTVLALFGTTSVMANNETTSSVSGLLSSFAGSKILLIGILDSSLIVITKDTPQLVYDVPMAKRSKNMIDLYGLAPVQLNSKWPALSSNSNFTSAVLPRQALSPLSISIKLDNEKLVCAFDIGTNPQLKLIVKTVELAVSLSSASYQEYQIDGIFFLESAHFISSTEQNVFFNLIIISGKSPQLVKYVYQGTGFKATSTPYMCKQTGTNGTEMVVFKDDSSGCTNMDWDIQNGGFVDQNRFHLFSHDTVYIFEYTGAGADPAGVPVNAVKLSDYFVDVIPTTTTHFRRVSTKKAGASIGMIIGIVLAVVVAVVVIITVVVWCKHKKAPHSKDLEMSRSNSNRKLGVGQSQSQAQPSQLFKQSPSAQATNTSAFKNPTESRGVPSGQAQQNVSVLKPFVDGAPPTSSTNQPAEQKHDPYLPFSDQVPKNAKINLSSCQFTTPEMSKSSAATEVEKRQQMQNGPSKEVMPGKVKSGALPDQESDARLAEAEAQKKKKKGSLRRRTSSGRRDSRQKGSPKQRTSSSKQKQQSRGKLTLKAKFAKLAAKHSKGKGSKGSVASRKPTTKKSSRRKASKGGRKGSKASKGSNRKFYLA